MDGTIIVGTSVHKKAPGFARGQGRGGPGLTCLFCNVMCNQYGSSGAGKKIL
jgi:hypothetical protein